MLAGLEVLGDSSAEQWRTEIDAVLTDFATRALQAEQGIREAIESGLDAGQRAARLLLGLLLAFASRPPSRERTTIITTNYDRLIEYGCDVAGFA